MHLEPGFERSSWIASLAFSRWPLWISMLMLCSAYIQGGYEKSFHFHDALGELQHFGLPPSPFLVLSSIAVEWGGPLLILTGFFRWLGALALAGFTCYASWLANRFWAVPPEDMVRVSETFYEHVGLVGGFLAVALIDLRSKVLSASAVRTGAPAQLIPDAKMNFRR